MSPSEAEIIALKGLAFLVNSVDAAENFVNVSGLDPADLRARAGEPEVLVAVLDYLLAGDTLLTGFCDAEAYTPRAVHMARHQLSGG
jgi:Protein of unknown function (DUF3572)